MNLTQNPTQTQMSRNTAKRGSKGNRRAQAQRYGLKNRGRRSEYHRRRYQTAQAQRRRAAGFTLS